MEGFDWWFKDGVMCACDHEVLIGHSNAALERHMMGSQAPGTSLGAGFAVQHLQSGGKLSSLTKSESAFYMLVTYMLC